MRIGGLIFVLILAGLGFAATFFITDARIEENIEYQASMINEAKVEIDGLNFDLYNLQMRWDRLQVTNPNDTWENTFETGETEFKMRFWPLIMKRKVIIENVQLSGFQLDTERETDGVFEMPEEEEEAAEPGFIQSVITQVASEAKQNAEVKFTDVRDDVNVDSLLAKLNLQSVNKIDSLQNGLRKNYAKWDSTFRNTDVRKEINKVENTVQAIKPKEIKDVKKAIEAIENVQKLKKQADSLKTRAEELKNNFEQDFNSAKYNIGMVDNWVRDDYQRALSLARLPTLDAQNIGKALFGEKLLADYAGYLEYVAIAREYGSRLIGDEEKKEKIERYEGLDYAFSDKYEWPGFWIKNVALSGKTKSDIELSGSVNNISSSQTKTGEPVHFDLGGTDENNVSLKLTGEVNYLGEEPTEKFNVNYSGYTLSKARISASDLLPYELKSGKGEINTNLEIIGRRFDSRIDYYARGISFDFASAGRPKNRIESLIRTAISGTDDIDVSVLVGNTEGPLKVKVRTNVDDLFLTALKKTVSREVENAKRKLETEVRNRIEPKKRQLEEFKAQKEKELRQEYEKLQQKVEEQLALVEQKKEELEKKKKELQDSLEEKAKDAVEDRLGIDF